MCRPTWLQPRWCLRMAEPRRIIVGISGASGAVYGVALLQALRAMPGVQTHLVVSDAGWLNIQHETALSREQVLALAHQAHDNASIGASIASGSFGAQAMVVAPCSMRTLAAIAHGLGDNLLTRAADVMLKERRRLVLVAREAPLNLAHLRNMTSVTEMGAIVYPPVPAFYQHPQTVDDVVRHCVARVLDLIDVPQALSEGWSGLPNASAVRSSTVCANRESGVLDTSHPPATSAADPMEPPAHAGDSASPHYREDAILPHSHSH